MILIVQPQSFKDDALHLVHVTVYVTVYITLLFKLCKWYVSVFFTCLLARQAEPQLSALCGSYHPLYCQYQLVSSCTFCSVLLDQPPPALHLMQI